MKRHETWFSVFLAVSLITASCVGGSESTSPVSPAPATETVTPSTVETPTPAAAASASADDLIGAAIARLDAEVAAGDGPSETFAYDLIDSKIDAEGFVTLTICAWTGDTVFDTVRDSLYRTEVEADGSISASHVTTPVAAGDCVNTQLFESAFDFINEFTTFWADISADPISFGNDDRASTLMTEGYLQIAESFTATWLDDDISFNNSFTEGDVRAAAIADTLYRRYSANDHEILEIVVCRDMNLLYGAYRDEVLIDDSRGDGDPGLHAVDAYQLVASQDRRGELELAGSDGLIWSDCFATGNWPGAANVWRTRDTPLEALPK